MQSFLSHVLFRVNRRLERRYLHSIYLFYAMVWNKRAGQEKRTGTQEDGQHQLQLAGREILLSWKMYFKNGRLCYDSRVVVAAVAQCSRNMDNKKLCDNQITTVLSDLKLLVAFGITVHSGLRLQHMKGHKEVIDVICGHRPSLEVTIV